MRIAWLSSTMSSTVCSDEPRLGLLEELGALRAAEHDRDLMLAVLRQPDHRAHVEPVLPVRQLMPSQPSAARTMPSIGAAFGLGGMPSLRIFSANSIGYGSVDNNDSNTETSTSTTPRVSAEIVRNAVSAPSAA